MNALVVSLFNGLLVSISPSAVHSGASTHSLSVIHESTAGPKYACEEDVPQTMGENIEVSFVLNDQNELEILSVKGSSPLIEYFVKERLSLEKMPVNKRSGELNKPQSIHLKLSDLS